MSDPYGGSQQFNQKPRLPNMAKCALTDKLRALTTTAAWIKLKRFLTKSSDFVKSMLILEYFNCKFVWAREGEYAGRKERVRNSWKWRRFTFSCWAQWQMRTCTNHPCPKMLLPMGLLLETTQGPFPLHQDNCFTSHTMRDMSHIHLSCFSLRG